MTAYFGGCDVGSTTGKSVILKDGEIVADAIIKSRIDPEETARLVMADAVSKTGGIDRVEDIAYLVGTGYGRNEVPFANENISEITCHSVGAHFCDRKIRTIIDIGGQDVKAISVRDDGSVLEFAMNDKCAAGTGKFFEAMSRTFDMSIEDFSRLPLKANRLVPVTAQCSVFAETEVVSLISRKKPPADIAAGIHAAVAKRCYTLARRVGVRPKVTMTGGCAKNAGLMQALEKVLHSEVTRLDYDPQLVGALGAAVLAMRKCDR